MLENDLPKVAVIGAGISGLICARVLVEHGMEVTVFEKSRGIGGRMSTRRSPEGYAQPREPLPESYLIDLESRIGACGDWCGGPRVEGAFLSGLALGSAVVDAIGMIQGQSPGLWRVAQPDVNIVGELPERVLAQSESTPPRALRFRKASGSTLLRGNHGP